MTEEKTEETIENQEEEETPEEEPQEVEQEIPEEKPDATSKELEEKNKRLYARMKKAEEETKLAKEELEKVKGKPKTSSDVFGLAKTVSALKEYSPEELDFIQLMSEVRNMSPEEAAKTEEAKLYISARRQKVEAEKQTPEPSTKQSPSKKSLDKITPEDVSNMTLKEKEEYFIKIGWMKRPREVGKR